MSSPTAEETILAEATTSMRLPSPPRIRRVRRRLDVPNKIGEGGHTCVYAPAVPCRGQLPSECRDDPSKCVVRLSPIADVETTLRATKDAKVVDPDSHYIQTVFPEWCESRPSTFIAMQDLPGLNDLRKTCPRLHKQRILVTYMPRATDSLQDRIKSGAINMGENVTHLLHALCHFRRNSFVHGDAKAQNVMYFGAFPRFIDLDFAFIYTDADSVREHFRTRFADLENYSKYWVWPPEALLFKRYLAWSEKPFTVEDARDAASNWSAKTSAALQADALKTHKLLFTAVHETFAAMLETKQQEGSDVYRLSDAALMAIAQAWDVWGVGMLFSELNAALPYAAFVDKKLVASMLRLDPTTRPEPCDVFRALSDSTA